MRQVVRSVAFGPPIDRVQQSLMVNLPQHDEDGRPVTGVEYTAALNARGQYFATGADLLLNYGTNLPPAALGPAPKGLVSTGNPVFCGFWTYLGVPAVTLPLLEVDGLPMGVQLIGARRDDGRLLRTAQQLVRRLEPANA